MVASASPPKILTPRLGSIVVRDLVEEVRLELELRAQAAGVRLASQAEELVIQADDGLLRRVLVSATLAGSSERNAIRASNAS